MTAPDRPPLPQSAVAEGLLRDLVAALEGLRAVAVWDEDFDAGDIAEFGRAMDAANAVLAKVKGKERP